MTDRISLALVLHNHQPVGNFGWVIAETYERAYLPMLAALERHPGIRVGLHYTGPLLDWIRAERAEFLDRLGALVTRDQVELLGGGYFEPVLASLPERDRIDQLRRMAVEIERIGGRRPAGAWLAERVWEPGLPTSIVDAGYRWTILDDSHFRAAALDDDALWGPYTTEDQDRLLIVFGSDRKLRYGIPFGRVEDIVAHLEANASPAGDRLSFMGDDGEKFGGWPDTYEHCWGADGWVDRFFGAVEAHPAIATVTPSDWLLRHRPIGRIYIPTASYFEMGEWALPADQGLAFEAAVKAAEADGAPWARWLQGGFWRNFQVKYREINDLHKQMLRVSAMVVAMPASPEADLARDHLQQGQSNDCYWHGVFGGIYISHMRLATHEHLIAAEDLADRTARLAGTAGDGIARVDTDLDGIDEILITTAGQVAVVDPAEGGGLGTWDIRTVRHALTAVMRRRPEAYHARLLAGASEGDGTGDGAAAPASDGHTGQGAATIHQIVRSREPGLAARLRYDAYERRSGLVHLFAPGTTATAFAEGTAVELGDAVDGAYDVESIGSDALVLAREVRLRDSSGIVRVVKRFAFGGDRARPSLDLAVTVENRSAEPVRFDLGVEWALTMLGGGGNPAAFYRIGDESLDHDSTGARAGIGSIASGNTYIGLELTTTVEPPAHTWWAPIETISNSEGGFERIYQGSALLFAWPLELAPDETRTVSVRNLVATTRDRATEELVTAD
ncbi:MAG: alpha-amylase/4-alpha-glucanotransferase domain-containing protein [Candidatus Limnocylindrales bacterium]